MSIIHAKRFLGRIHADKDFRDQICNAEDFAEKKKIIEQEGFIFNRNSFQEAYASMLFLANNKQQRLQIEELAQWFHKAVLH